MVADGKRGPEVDALAFSTQQGLSDEGDPIPSTLAPYTLARKNNYLFKLFCVPLEKCPVSSHDLHKALHD
jgi:hypothetical protein